MELGLGDYLFFLLMIVLFLHVVFLLIATDCYYDRSYQRYLDETDHEPGDWITIDDFPFWWDYEFLWDDIKKYIKNYVC